MTAFRDAIYLAAREGIDANGHFDREVADVVLDMPEMQAIKTALLDRFAPLAWSDPQPDVSEWDMRVAGLPDSIIEWVLS